jgi:hypothetical protein
MALYTTISRLSGVEALATVAFLSIFTFQSADYFLWTKQD